MKKIILLLSMMFLLVMTAGAQKREMRGAWIQCVNGQFQGMGTAKMQQTLTYQLDELQKDGVNMIIFQVRPECDALYESKIEPWSRFLTGKQGVAPKPYWDPLQWMITECHKRGMELHAWINPYRAKTKGTRQLASNHIAVRKPMSCFAYDELFILNPGMAENRDYICEVAKDIVSRYDVDGIHMDDYFYPSGTEKKFDAYVYSTAQKENPDLTLEAFRVANVDQLVKEIHDAVKAVNPSIRFGISPAGNNDNNHSLYYAYPEDWVAQGTVDYLIPQIYWGFLHPVKPYESTLQEWLKITEGSDVLLMPGLAAYSIGETYDLGSKKANREWVTNDDMLERQTAMALDTYGCSGVVYYSYSSLWAPTEDTKKIVENEIVHIKNYISSR